MALRRTVKDLKASWRGAGRFGADGGAEGWCSPPPSQGWMARGATRRGGEAGCSVGAWEEACVSASCSGATSAAEAFEARTSAADSKGVEALGGFSTKSGRAALAGGGSVVTPLFRLQISPSSVLSSASSFDTTLGAFLLALWGGIFFRSGARRAAALDGPTGEDWP